ncbi:MAG: hypothetical protein PF689_06620 [Deltaproteobacteria bacterium]|jgi:hypothetical protein|nr:hypothetical protein [Deltaproteobacteria bacterium]
MKNSFKILTIIFFLVFSLGCENDDEYNPVPPNDSGVDADSAQDHIVLPDVPDADPEGPEITITNPEAEQVISADFLKIKAVIVSGSSSVDYSSVTVTVEGNEFSMTVDPTTDKGFMVTIDLSEIPDGDTTFRITAKDVQGRTSYADRTFNLDKGPTFTVHSPEDNGRYHGALNLSFTVYDNDGVIPGDTTCFIGNVEIELTVDNESTETANGNPLSVTYNAEIVFEDSIFSPPLTGEKRIILNAFNSLTNSTTRQIDFTIDNSGPVISILSHSPGEIIGGIIQVEAEVNDPAGVQTSSVFAIIGNNDLSYEISLAKVQGTDSYTGSFDTSVLPGNFVWPALQVFASDQLENESSIGFEIALDNTSPLVSMDPPENFRLAEENADGFISCSWQFDPVGKSAVDDMEVVPQLFWMRARVEDQGNYAPGSVYTPLSLVNYSTVELYILDDTDEPLVVDSNSDGICDSINPELVPTVHLTGSPLETLMLQMNKIDPNGSADFTVDPSLPNLSIGCQAPGDNTDPPDPLCPVLSGDMTTAIWYTFDMSEPAIYTLPPVDSTSPTICGGIQFDSMANNISEGWTCAAVKANDNAGNTGISQPLRICIEYNYDPVQGPQSAECQNELLAPDCTGTLDNSISPPLVTSTPCTSRQFAQNEVRRKDLN